MVIGNAETPSVNVAFSLFCLFRRLGHLFQYDDRDDPDVDPEDQTAPYLYAPDLGDTVDMFDKLDDVLFALLCSTQAQSIAGSELKVGFLTNGRCVIEAERVNYVTEAWPPMDAEELELQYRLDCYQRRYRRFGTWQQGMRIALMFLHGQLTEATDRLLIETLLAEVAATNGWPRAFPHRLSQQYHPAEPSQPPQSTERKA